LSGLEVEKRMQFPAHPFTSNGRLVTPPCETGNKTGKTFRKSRIVAGITR